MHITITRAGILAAIIAAGLAACSPQPAESPARTADPATTRDVDQGALVGFTSSAEHDALGGVHVWRGIPFAAAPEGDLRWRAPETAAVFDGTFEALAFGPRCPQITNALDEGEGVEPGQLLGDEDCLTLNIYAPAFPAGNVPTADEGLPVMVWIHGGGNVWGRASTFDGTNLAGTENVIVVTVQYRLGPLGWLSHEALRETATTEDGMGANFALLDLVAALEWVQDNIPAFGGDPDRVTIFGESAGGHNVAGLLGSARASGLFHRAIVQSGVFSTVPREEAEGLSGSEVNPGRTAVGRMLEAAGRAAGDQDTLSADEVAGVLRDQALDTVFDAYLLDGPAGLIMLPRMIADGVTLPAGGIQDAITSPNTFNAVPVMTGTNRDETKLFNMLNPDYVNRYLGIIVIPKDNALYNVISDYQSQLWRVRAVDEPAQAMLAGGHGDVYAYRFDWDEEGNFLWSDFQNLLGAGHAVEIPFVFGDFNFFGRLDPIIFTKKNEPGRLEISEAMMARWAEFAATGEPGGGWERWDQEGRLMVFDTSADGGIREMTGTLTTGIVLADLEEDDRLDSEEKRCTAFDAVAAWYPLVEEYRGSFLGGACPAE